MFPAGQTRLPIRLEICGGIKALGPDWYPCPSNSVVARMTVVTYAPRGAHKSAIAMHLYKCIYGHISHIYVYMHVYMYICLHILYYITYLYIHISLYIHTHALGKAAFEINTQMKIVDRVKTEKLNSFRKQTEEELLSRRQQLADLYNYERESWNSQILDHVDTVETRKAKMMER